MKRAIVWFKTDLRLQDNETLVQAIAQSDEVIPVYCFDEAHFTTNEFGLKKTGSHRLQFLLESLQDLDKNLRDMGSGLVVVKGNPVVELVELAKKYQVKKVFAKKEVAHEELTTQQELEKELWKLGCSIEVHSTSTLYYAQDLPFSVKDIPDVFTTFRKKVEKEATIKGVFDKPLRISSPPIEPVQWPSFPDFSLQPMPTDKRAVLPFKGGETAAWERLNHYFFATKSLSTYKETRNGMIGADYSSKFSAWLAMGCISPRSIYAEIKKYERDIQANDSTYWLVFELLWRDYFRFVTKKYPTGFFTKQGITQNKDEKRVHNKAIFTKWVNGQTDNDFVNANMLELQLTGFMSNRGRQNVASYLCNDLKLDWRYGAAYFEQQLIDYDVCSNWGNWAYLAGVGNDPRENRVFNIEKQANEYDKNKFYRNLWLKKI